MVGTVKLAPSAEGWMVGTIVANFFPLTTRYVINYIKKKPKRKVYNFSNLRIQINYNKILANF